MPETYYRFIVLISSIAFIIWLTAFKKINAFFVLLLAALAIGFLDGLPADKILSSLKAGFGHTMEKIGMLIILGTTLGILLEKTGATHSMANAILTLVKKKNAPVAIALTGFIVGIPIFCDSGFIVLSSLNRSLVQKTRQRMPAMASILATALYSVHCLVPPHPGITAAVATTGADIGMVMIWGLALAMPAALVGYAWAMWKGDRTDNDSAAPEVKVADVAKLPPAILSFLPVLFPILLIAAKSLALLYNSPSLVAQNALLQILSFIGDPVIALMIGILSSFMMVSKPGKKEIPHWLAEGVEKAGMILAIIAAGGMFGEMLQATGMSSNVGAILGGKSLGIFFPFLVAVFFKTAQGSSTVAVIATASLVAPVLPILGLASGLGLTLATLSMGAGSMVVSHANDAYFWVIGRFSNLNTATTLKVYSVATVLMGLVVQLLIWLVCLLNK